MEKGRREEIRGKEKAGRRGIERKINPNNLTLALLESYADFYQLFLNENPIEYQKIYPEFEKKIKLMFNLILEKVD